MYIWRMCFDWTVQSTLIINMYFIMNTALWKTIHMYVYVHIHTNIASTYYFTYICKHSYMYIPLLWCCPRGTAANSIWNLHCTVHLTMYNEFGLFVQRNSPPPPLALSLSLSLFPFSPEKVIFHMPLPTFGRGVVESGRQRREWSGVKCHKTVFSLGKWTVLTSDNGHAYSSPIHTHLVYTRVGQ